MQKITVKIFDGEYTREWNGKIKSRTNKHIATVNSENETTWIRGGSEFKIKDIIVALNKATSNQSKIYSKDGFYGTESDHKKGFDGIES